MSNKNKLLFILALIIVVGVSWFFGRNVDIEPPLDVATPEIDYQATEIQAVQTNAQGETEYQLNAKSLSHNNTTNKDELVDMTMDWNPSEIHHYRLTAGLTDFNQETGQLLMHEGFQLLSEPTAKGDSINIHGKSLTANTHTKQLASTERIEFKQGDNQFTAQAMTANLATGEYEFQQVELEFEPSKRMDKPLF